MTKIPPVYSRFTSLSHDVLQNPTEFTVYRMAAFCGTIDHMNEFYFAAPDHCITEYTRYVVFPIVYFDGLPPPTACILPHGLVCAGTHIYLRIDSADIPYDDPTAPLNNIARFEMATIDPHDPVYDPVDTVNNVYGWVMHHRRVGQQPALTKWDLDNAPCFFNPADLTL